VGEMYKLYKSIDLIVNMAGPGEGKKLLKGLKVYIHEKGKSGATVTHLDIEGDISKIIKDKEITFVKGKKGGVFIALKKNMIGRAEKLIKK
jgi:hypothetical protein